MSNPYFYIIEHIETEIKYAGIRFKDNCDPSELLTEDGYKTSSKIVKEIIKNEGLSSFRILEIKNFDDAKSCQKFETRFLKDYDCRNSDEWFNKKTSQQSKTNEVINDINIKKSFNIIELPSYEYLHECFEYDKDTGILKWKIRPLEHFMNLQSGNAWNTKYSGKICNTKSAKGYLTIKINHIRYNQHRIIWKMITGNDPKELIDHIDGNKANNKFDNLREASIRENNRNKKLNKNNTSGFKGVSYSKNKQKYHAQCQHNYKNYNLGYYDTAEEASEVYLKFINEKHGEFASDGQ